jgi:hypothetical protein
MPVSVNECNLREVYTIAPREVRQMGNDDVRREMMTYVRTYIAQATDRLW